MEAGATRQALTVTGPEADCRVPLTGGEVVVGRSDPCDVTLPDRGVSRLHARLFQDPLGRWIIEDLNSRHGVRVGGQPIAARVVVPGETIEVGPYRLVLEPPVPAGPSVRGTPMPVEEDPDTRVLPGPDRPSETISEGRLHQLNVISDGLAAVEGPMELYPAVCRALAPGRGTVAMVLRLSAGSAGRPPATERLAYHIGGEAEAEPDVSALRLSRRVLEAVQSQKRPVLASNEQSAAGGSMELTLVDEACPRTVACAPLGEGSAVEEVLYVDLPAGEAGDDVLDFIQAVARQVRFVRKSLLLADERQKQRLVEQEIRRAAEIQARLTPTGAIGVPGIDVAVHYEPAMWVGGDYCDLWPLAGGGLAFAVGDVSGHGLAAAMVMTNLHAALRSAMASSPRPAGAIQQVADYLLQHMTGGMFVTLVLGLLRPSEGRLEYVNAGHPLPFVLAPGAAVSELGKPEYPPLGIVRRTFGSRSVDLAPGATLVIVTDGITEAQSPTGEFFGTERLRDVLRDQAGKPSREILDALKGVVGEFRHSRTQHDDATALSLRYCPGG